MTERYINYAGKRFATFTVEVPLPELASPGMGKIWQCRCKCGEAFNLSSAYIRKPRPRNRCKCKLGRRYHASTKLITGGSELKQIFYYTRHRALKLGQAFNWPSFEAFSSSVTARPSSDHYFTRKDLSQPWGPGNWHWVNRTKIKTKNNRYITFQGQTQTVTAWALQLGMRVDTLYNRLFLKAWSIERALTTPVRSPNIARNQDA